ncbi:hypothetical protein HMPREF3192_00837 [Atopobium deltae]|uniref:Uncharacterized protein n=1 Tax=Atopobium deltae TaxID=1393034 RepID=A0A133XTZ6_9ACTN|nr:hypothetical protein HMPREF3192_00837 [Atopobium deltae]
MQQVIIQQVAYARCHTAGCLRQPAPVTQQHKPVFNFRLLV